MIKLKTKFKAFLNLVSNINSLAMN